MSRDTGVTCATCEACCCRLEVILMGDDDVPTEMIAGNRHGQWTMQRLADGWCVAVDRNTMQCTIYERRPYLCREYAMGGSDCVQERAESVVWVTTPARGD